MAGTEDVGLQADISSIPSAALTSVGFAQGLLRAVSADNVNPLAVVQVQAIGACFQSNGDWAARAPDLLTRTSSVRLERLSAWIGWAKGDAPSFMSQTAGGRSASLLCVALGSLYSKERCGMILFDVSRDLLPSDKQTSGLSQLGDVCMCLESKLACLGFGNHLAIQLTRLRQCFFEADLEVPRDLADTPTEEVMHAFLVCVRNALCDENLILHYSGTKCAGSFLSLVLAMCPEDVFVEVNGETVTRGCRDSIIFSISDKQNVMPKFYVERKLKAHTDDFYKTYIVEGQHGVNPNLNYSWDGMLSSRLDVALAVAGARPTDSLKQALATLVASAVLSFRGRDWLPSICRGDPGRYIPLEGLKTLLGPRYQHTVQERLERVLYLPSETPQDFVREYATLHVVAAASLRFDQCTCGDCGVQPWGNPTSFATKARKLCPVAQLWKSMGQIAHTAVLGLFIHALPNASLRVSDYFHESAHFSACFWERGWIGDHGNMLKYGLTARGIHEATLGLIGRWVTDITDTDEERPPRICSSADGLTIYPKSLQFPSITNPWSIQYDLVDGRLYYASDCYSFIICTSATKGSAKRLSRKKTAKTLSPKGQPISPSAIGEHSSLAMSLRPSFVKGRQALILRCLITQSTSTVEVDFEQIHLGFMSLTPANACEHDLRMPFSPSGHVQPVKATSVVAPGASGGDAIGVTLTHKNAESQFLCCIGEVQQLYQGDCCIACAVAQAREMSCSVVIGGSPSTYWVVSEDENVSRSAGEDGDGIRSEEIVVDPICG